MPTPAAGSLSAQIGASAYWRVLRAGLDNVLRFVTFLILARFLTPAQFGAFAIATVFVSVSGLLARAGMGDVLVRDENPDIELQNTIFWANFALETALAIMLIGFSPLIAYAIGDSQVQLPLVILSITLIGNSFSAVNNALAVRSLQIKPLEIVGVASSVLGSIAAISAALSGGGLWALVSGNVAVTITTVILTYILFPWRPKLIFSWKRLKNVLSFSGNALAASVLQLLIVRMQELIASVTMTLTSVGLYRVGSRFMELLCEAFVAPVASLALPALTKLRSDSERMAAGYLRMTGVTSLIYSPMIVGFAAVAPDAVPLIFGNTWLASVTVIQILSLLAPATVLAYYHGPTLSAYGRTDILWRITLVQFFGTLVFSSVGALFGVTGLAIAFVLRSYFTLPLQMRWLREGTGVDPRLALVAALKPFAASLVMALFITAIQPLLQTALPSAVARLLISVALGACVYCAIMGLLFGRETMREFATLREMVAARKGPGANS